MCQVSTMLCGLSQTDFSFSTQYVPQVLIAGVQHNLQTKVRDQFLLLDVDRLRNCCFSTEHEVECKILSLVKAKMKRVKNGEKIYRESLSSLTSAVTCIRMISLKWR